jgi:hypothetical protein
VLLDGRGGMPVAEVLDVSRDVDRAHTRNRGDAVVLQPSAERADRPHVGQAGVRVADLSGEEFEEAIGGAFPSGIDEGGGFRGRKGDELGHGIAVVGVKPSIAASLGHSSGISTGSITRWTLGQGRSNVSRTNRPRKRIQHRRVVQ